MARFYNESLGFQDLESDNSLVRLNDCLKLIEKSEFKDDLLELFDFEKIKNEPVLIRGISKVISSIILRDNEFKKLDLKSHISNITCVGKVDSNTVRLRFNDAKDLGLTSIEAKTVYSAKRDFFEGFYKIDKFADFCITEGHFSILKNTVDELNKKYEEKESDSYFKSFRLLRNREGEYFVRGITSVSRYHDYNIRFSLFVTIVALWNVMKKTNHVFKVSRCEYNESFIRVYFRKNNPTRIPNIGTLSFVLEMSNDEIKRGAFKFCGVFNLRVENNKEQVNVLLKPKSNLDSKRLRTNIMSIGHGYSPSKVIEYLKGITKFISDAEELMKDDIIALNEIEKPDQLRFAILRTIERSTSKDISTYKIPIKKTLDVRINRISELIVLMGKVDNIATDLEAKEYLRYLFYDALRKK